MVRLKIALVAALLASPAAAQQCGTLTTCPQVSTPLAGSELLYVVQGGVSKKMTASTLGGAITPFIALVPGMTISPSTNGGLLWDNNGVLGDSKTLPSGISAPSLTVTSAFTATGLVTNADLANASVTVNGATCTLGLTCTAPTALVVGTSTIGSGTNGDIEYNNSGVLGEKGVTGSGLVVEQTSPSLTTPALGVATATSINGVTIGASGGALSIASGKTLTDTSGVGAGLLLGATGGGFTAYGGASSAGNVLTALSAAGAGSFQAYGLTGNSTLVETTSGGLITASLLPAATTSTLGAVSTDGATIANSSGAISCRTATSSLLGCASFGTGLSITAGAVTPTFGTATNQVAEGGVITAAGPIGSATAVPVITYNAAGQLTTVTTAALGTAAADNTGTSGATIPLNNGGFTQSGAATFSSTFALSATTLPSVVAGQLGLAGGNTSNPTLGANDEGAVYLTTVNGLTNIGKGSTYDTALLDSAGGVALGVQTGTLNLTFGGGVTAASLATPSSNIGGALCATTGGVFLYNVGANCYAGGGTAGGSNTQVQWNTSGSLGGITGVTSNGTAMTFANADLILAGSSSGTETLEAAATASGVITFPAATDTVDLIGTAQTFTALKTFATSDLAINGGTATAGLATVTSGGVVSSEAQATLAQGGTAASLTASNGGVVYSTASTFAVLAGTATANQCLLSGSGAAPTWGACPSGSLGYNGGTPATVITGTSFVTAGVTLASQTMASGSQWRVRATGTVTGGTGGALPQAEIFWGGTAIAVDVFPSTTGPLSATTYSFEIEILINGTSTSAATLATYCTLIPVTSSSAIFTISLSQTASPTGITTGAQTLDLQADWSSTSGSPTMRVNEVTIERLK